MSGRTMTFTEHEMRVLRGALDFVHEGTKAAKRAALEAVNRRGLRYNAASEATVGAFDEELSVESALIRRFSEGPQP